MNYSDLKHIRPIAFQAILLTYSLYDFYKIENLPTRSKASMANFLKSHWKTFPLFSLLGSKSAHRVVFTKLPWPKTYRPSFECKGAPHVFGCGFTKILPGKFLISDLVSKKVPDTPISHSDGAGTCIKIMLLVSFDFESPSCLFVTLTGMLYLGVAAHDWNSW